MFNIFRIFLVLQFLNFFLFTRIDEKMSSPESLYTREQAQDILGRIRNIQKSLHSGQREKLDLMQELARLKDEFFINKLQGGSSPDVSTLSINNINEKISMASQTDLTEVKSFWVRGKILDSNFESPFVIRKSISTFIHVSSCLLKILFSDKAINEIK